MENSQISADIAYKIQEMQEEISSLRAKLAAKERENTNRSPDLKAMFEEGFAKLHEAIQPVVERANAKLGEPAREAVAHVGEKISIHPFAAIIIALGTGLIVGKLLDVGSRYQTVTTQMPEKGN